MIIMSVGALGAFAADNSATGFDGDTSNCGVYDDKGIFSASEIDELDSLVRETSEELDLYIAIYLSDTARSETSTRVFADDYYEELFEPDSDGVLYYMDLSEQYSAYDFISTSGKAMLLYDENTDEMLESIFRYLPSSGEPIYASDIESGIEEICRVLKEYNDEPGRLSYEYDSYTGKYIYYRDGKTVISDSKPFAVRMGSLLMYGVPVGLVVGLLCYFITKHHYKFKQSCSPMTYVSREETKFHQREDRFIRAHTESHRIERNNGGSSGGGGGGGFHGGSGSHGGGGGHR
jgi:uncharacterized protein